MERVFRLKVMVKAFVFLTLALMLAAGGSACAKKSTQSAGTDGKKVAEGAEAIPAGSRTTLDERGRVRTQPGQGEALVADALFDFNSAVLTRQGRKVLDEASRILAKNPTWSLVVEGHCDERGTEEYNLALGQRRAHSAASYLKQLGIGAERLDPVSFGEAYPADPGHDEAAWAKNRRVHLGFEQPPALSTAE